MVSGRVQSMDGGTWPAPSCGLKAAKVDMNYEIGLGGGIMEICVRILVGI